MLVDKVVVTGAGRGIGRAAALDLGATGIAVACVARTANATETAAQIVESGGIAVGAAIDLAGPPSEVSAAVAALVEELPGVRVGAVLAAGTLGPRSTDAFDLSDWTTTFATNVVGNVASVAALVPSFRATRFGRAVFLGGGGAAYGYPLFAAYAASKVAVVRTAENLHAMLAPLGDVAVVCLAPGAVETDMLEAVVGAGGDVRTRTAVAEPVGFIERFLSDERAGLLGGRFVHVRDDWAGVLAGSRSLDDDEWTLRRVEP